MSIAPTPPGAGTICSMYLRPRVESPAKVGRGVGWMVNHLQSFSDPQKALG